MSIKFLAVSVIIFISGCQTTTNQNSNTDSLVTYGLIFGVKQNLEGKVITVRYSGATDPKTKKMVEFTPSQEYLVGAERQIKSRTFDKPKDHNKESFVACFYADIRPNQAICGGEL